MHLAITYPKRLNLSLMAVLILSGMAACSSTPAQNVAPVATPSASAMPGMDHSTMDHGSMNSGAMAHMDLGPADANFDLRFIDGMVPHHEGAVTMAQAAQPKAKHPELKKFANGIIAAQTPEIAQMQQWRSAWYPQAGAVPMAYDGKLGKMVPMSAEQKQGMMMRMDLGAADDQFDLRFLNAMIPHHEAAVTMANQALQKSKRSEIKQLATAIVGSQQAEINQMKQWRKAWYNQ